MQYPLFASACTPTSGEGSVDHGASQPHRGAHSPISRRRSTDFFYLAHFHARGPPAAMCADSTVSPATSAFCLDRCRVNRYTRCFAGDGWARWRNTTHSTDQRSISTPQLRLRAYHTHRHASLRVMGGDAVVVRLSHAERRNHLPKAHVHSLNVVLSFVFPLSRLVTLLLSDCHFVLVSTSF